MGSPWLALSDKRATPDLGAVFEPHVGYRDDLNKLLKIN